jgi:hypothetical protein
LDESKNPLWRILGGRLPPLAGATVKLPIQCIIILGMINLHIKKGIILPPVYDYEDSAGDEEEYMKLWSNENRMSLNMEKTYEMIVRGKCLLPFRITSHP